MREIAKEGTEMARLKEIVIDADDPPKLARWWAQVADGYEVRPYDDDEIERLAAIGLTPETDTSVMVDGPGPTLCFQLRRGPRPFATGCTWIWRRRTGGRRWNG